MRARFDDLRPGRRRSLELTGLVGTAEARTTDDVPALLAEAEARAAAGEWVAFGLTYEAAAGLDSALTVHPHRGPVPLGWYAAYLGVDRIPPWRTQEPHHTTEWELGLSPPEHRATVEEIRRLVAAGETYQVNVTFPLRSHLSGDPFSLYRFLAEGQSAGYSAFMATDAWAVLSASPELFLRWDRGGKLVTRPMKGTRRRGASFAEDVRLRDELESSSKERAENVMIVDLLRNDLGKVCEFGTVSVDELFDLEEYGTVWQMTSQVSGAPRSDVGLVDVMRALFPCGSVTGVPKVRTMEIIHTTEPEPRGIYCGTLGYLSPEDRESKLHCNVAIRTVELDRITGEARYGVGGGITWYSDAAEEWQEAIAKTAVLTADIGPLALIETMRWEPGRGVLWRDVHMQRLAASAEHFGVRLDLDDIESRLDTISADEDLRVRLSVPRAGPPRVELSPAPPLDEPIAVVIDAATVSSEDPMLYHKTNRRDVYEAAAARHPEYEDVLLVNEHGRVTESTRANVAVDVGGRWFTPPVRDGLLPGVLRHQLVEAGLLIERSMSVDDVLAAQAVQLISSLRGRRLVTLVDA